MLLLTRWQANPWLETLENLKKNLKIRLQFLQEMAQAAGPGSGNVRVCAAPSVDQESSALCSPTTLSYRITRRGKACCTAASHLL